MASVHKKVAYDMRKYHVQHAYDVFCRRMRSLSLKKKAQWWSPWTLGASSPTTT